MIKKLVIHEGNVKGGNYTAMILGKGDNTVLTECIVDGGTVSSSQSYVAGIAGALSEETGVILESCSNSASVTASKNVAGCVALVNGTDYTIEECTNSGNIISEDGGYCGGIVGDANSGTILQCVNDGALEAFETKSYQAGGIAGRATTVKECMNNGTITVSLGNRGTSESYVGGIAGTSATVKNCVNQGTITGKGGINLISGLSPTGSTSWQKEVDVYAHVAGIAAKSEKISECYNLGTITENTKNSYRGAIIAYSPGNIENCFGYNKNTPLAVGGNSVIVTNCYNIGGIIASSGTATNCYYYIESETKSGVGELRTKRQLRIKSTFTDWDFENVWTMEGNEDYLFPELIGMEPDYKKSLASISLAALPEKTTYLEQKETLDLTGAQLRLTYDNETTEKIPITDDMVSGFDNTAVGTKTITVSYQDYKVTFDVTVIAKSLASIAVTTLPNKLEYLEQKDTLNVTGGVLTLYYNNDTTETKTLTQSMVSGFDNTIVGPQTLTVTYGEKTTAYDVEIIEKSLARIAVTKLPTKTSYIELKETLDLTGGKLTLYYDNDQTELIDLSEAEVTGFDNKVVGRLTLTAKYQGFTTTFQVEIAEKSVSSIVLAAEPTTLSYLEGKDKLDVSGGRVRVLYNNDTEETIDLTKNMVSGFNNTIVGRQTLTITYGGKTTTYRVEIIAKTLTGILLKDKPAKLTYKEYKDTLDVTGGRITLIYDNGTTQNINMTKSMVTGFNNKVIGVQTLTVNYSGYIVTFDVEIVQKLLSSISVTTLPSKRSYLEAKDELDITGGRLTLYYDNDTQKTINMTLDMVSGFDNTRVGNQTLSVFYEGKRTTYTVEIIEKQLVSMMVENMPDKLTYEEGEELDLNGGQIFLTYDNGQSFMVPMSDEMISGFDSSKGGNYVLIITYDGGTTQIEIEVLHDYQAVVTEPTCEEDGYTTHTCAGCKDSYVDSEVGAFGHSYEATVTDPTCEESGYTTHVCGTCKDTYIDSETASLGHDLSDWITVEEATCETVGEEIKECSRCEYSETNEIPKLGHKYEATVTDPTCEEEGYTTHVCARCEDEYTDSEVDSLGHNYEAIVTEPTCEEIGYTTHTCERCEDAYVDSEVEELGHNYEETVVDPTCEEEGYTTHVCARCEDEYADNEVDALGHSFTHYISDHNATIETVGTKTAKCDRCDVTDTLPDPASGIPIVSGNKDIIRICGTNRNRTSYKVADVLKEKLNLEKFDAVIVATGKNFADALSGSYLAVMKNAPILLTNSKDDQVPELYAYIAETFNPDGQIYILGGEGAVSGKVEAYLSARYSVKRLEGGTRYETSLAILEEAGIEEGSELIVATGKHYADSLSASAAKRPILLVKPTGKLTAEQKSIAKMAERIYIVGGPDMVSESIESELRVVSYVERIAGSGRQETSKLIAEKFFADPTPEAVVLAKAMDFPDGLCGGPLAAAMDAPLLLVRDGKSEIAESYVQGEAIEAGIVLGGTDAVANETVIQVFGIDAFK